METIQMLGSLGEFVGAIAVVATLVYLAIQVRHSKEATDANTRSLDESRRLEMAHAYQARADSAAQAYRQMADSEYLAPIRQKLGDAPDRTDLTSLSPQELTRWAAWSRGWITDIDNMFYQYQQGFLDQENFDSTVKALILRFSPSWEALDVGITARPSFMAEVERILAESEAQS